MNGPRDNYVDKHRVQDAIVCISTERDVWVVNGQPALHIQPHPSVSTMMTKSLQQQVMIYVVKQDANIIFQHPIPLPTALSRYRYGIVR